MRVLIAEDHEISRKILGLFLKPYGELVVATDGKEAIDCYENAVTTSATFDLIVLDMVMPNLNGLEVLEVIRKKERECGGAGKPVPVIMLTGDGDTFQINQAKILGISDYMMKPIDEKRLIRELQRLQLIPDPQDQWG